MKWILAMAAWVVSVAFPATAQYREAAIDDVQAVNRFLVLDQGRPREIALTNIAPATGCHESWAREWARAVLPRGTKVQVSDQSEIRLFLEYEGSPVDYSAMAVWSGAARVATSVGPSRELLQPEEDVARQLGAGLWANKCANPDAFDVASKETGVAKRLLYAVAMTESGQRGRPHPWSLNVEGKGYTYPSRQEAHRALVGFIKKGHRSIDVGLMQVNLHFHGHRFKNTWDALDPHRNVRAGAQILKENVAQSNDVTAAVAAYHSKTPWRGQRYLAQVSANYQRAGTGAYLIH